MFCQIISFISKLFCLDSLLSALCYVSAQSTASSTNISSLPSTSEHNDNTQPTTVTSSIQPTISFSDEDEITLSCHHLPGTIQIIEATFGSADSSCLPANVTSYMSQYTNGKSTLLLVVSGYYFGDACKNSDRTTLKGTYTCSPINNTTPGKRLVVDSFEDIQMITSCPGGTITMENAVYGSIDEVTCPPKSVMSYPAFKSAHDGGLTSFSLFVSRKTTFYGLCSTGKSPSNKLTVTYKCQTTSDSVFVGVARYFGNLHMICPRGEINVTSVIFGSESNRTCFSNPTKFIRSLVPPKTTEAYFTNFYVLDDCDVSDNTLTARYSCVGTSVSQFTAVMQEFTQMVLQCQYGQNSKDPPGNFEVLLRHKPGRECLHKPRRCC